MTTARRRMELPTGTYKVLPSTNFSGAVVTVAGTILVQDDEEEKGAHQQQQQLEENPDKPNEPHHPHATRAKSRRRTLSIDIHTSAGVAIVDDRTYTFAWNQEEEAQARNKNGTTATTERRKTTILRPNNTSNTNNNSSITSKIGTLILDDNVFGSAKRTTLGPVRYDAAAQTLTVQALWTQKLPAWLGGAYTVQVPIRTVLQHTNTNKIIAAEAATTLPTTRTTTNTSLPSPVRMSSLPAPLLPSTAAVPSISLSRYHVFDAYIRRTSEQCAF